MEMEKTADQSLSFKISLWHGYIMSGIFLLYGGVQIVLSILDRNYGTMMQMILFAALGLILLMFVMMFAERKKFGWYGVILMNSLIIILGLLRYQYYENIILAVLSAVVLYLIYSEKSSKFL